MSIKSMVTKCDNVSKYVHIFKKIHLKYVSCFKNTFFLENPSISNEIVLIKFIKILIKNFLNHIFSVYLTNIQI